MATLHISLPEDLRDMIEREVEAHGYDTASEYVADLIRRDVEHRTR